MAVTLVLLAAVIAVVNGRPELTAGAEEQGSLDTIKTTTHCRTTIEVVYPSAEGEQPYPLCSSKCPRGEEELWIDGVVFKRLSELREYDLMVEMTHKNGSLQGCKMVPYENAQESVAKREAHARRMEFCFSNDKESQVETVVPSVTERIPTPTSIHVRLESFTQVGNSFYMVSPTVMTWHDAVKYCDGLGASLALIESGAEQDHLRGALSTDVWIGLNDLEEEGTFVDATNTPITWSNWYPWEPNNDYDGTEDCGMLYGRHQLQWNDMRCNSLLHALCEHPLVGESQAQYSCPEGYWQHKSSCYILSRTLNTNSQGENFCENEGAYPAFINSQDEQDFLAGMLSEDAFIGYSDRENEGKFVSSRFGIPLFQRWSLNEPNDMGGNEDCVTIEPRYQFLWNDVPCSDKFRILCEKAAEINS